MPEPQSTVTEIEVTNPESVTVQLINTEQLLAFTHGVAGSEAEFQVYDTAGSIFVFVGIGDVQYGVPTKRTLESIGLGFAQVGLLDDPHLPPYLKEQFQTIV